MYIMHAKFRNTLNINSLYFLSVSARGDVLSSDHHYECFETASSSQARWKDLASFPSRRISCFHQHFDIYMRKMFLFSAHTISLNCASDPLAWIRSLSSAFQIFIISRHYLLLEKFPLIPFSQDVLGNLNIGDVLETLAGNGVK